MNDHPQIPLDDLDALLETGLPQLPPEEVVAQVTPWRKAMDRVLWGLALSAITLQSFGLNYILPTLGALASFLGFRTLRQENQGFQTCFKLATLRGLILLATLILNASIYHHEIYASPWWRVVWVGDLILLFALLFSLRQGLRAVQEKAGLPLDSRGATALLLWYALLHVLALSHFGGTLLSLGMVAAFCLILRSLSQVTKSLDEAGYAVQAAPVRLTDRAVALLLAAGLLLGMACCYLFSNSYRMDWTPVDPTERQGLEDIEAHLTDLGFPREVLRDLSPEDLAACEGAIQVVSTTQDFPVNNGRQVTYWEGSTEVHTTVYDVEELRLTSVAVQLPGEWDTWRLFHHFQWIEDPGFWGTEAIQLFTADHWEGWMVTDKVTGRLLCERSGVTLTAPYHSLNYEAYVYDSIFWGEGDRREWFATFSLPRDGTDRRGYVTYPIESTHETLTIVDSWITYIHQRHRLQYPAQNAMIYRMSGSHYEEYTFCTVQDALQFYPRENAAVNGTW